MSPNISTRGAKILHHAVGLSVHQPVRQQGLGRGAPASPIGAALPEVLTPVARPVKLLFSFVPLPLAHGRYAITYNCSYINNSQAANRKPKLVIAALGSPRYALRKAYIPPAQTGEAVEMYRCSYIRVPDYMADYMADHPRIFDLYYCMLDMRDSPMTAASKG